MSIKSSVLALLLCPCVAHAATLHLASYDLQPHRQRVLITTAVSLGYPVGDAAVGLALDCTTGKVDLVNLGTGMFGSVPSITDYGAHAAEPALSKAVLESGLITVTPGVLSLKVTDQGTLVSRCHQGVLDATLIDTRHLGQTRSLRVPIYSREADQRYVSSANPLGYDADRIALEGDVYASPKGYDVQNLYVSNKALLPLANAQVLLSDEKAVFPILYAGRNQSNAALKNLKIPSVLTVYMTFDGLVWTKTTIDFKNNRVQTAPTTKPTLPVRS